MTKLKGTENITGFLDWDTSVSWPEAKDNPLGSGIYTGQCPECGKFFLGYKHRRLCTACYSEPEKPVICEHGRLKRQCNECDMQDEIDTLTEQNKQLVEALEGQLNTLLGYKELMIYPLRIDDDIDNLKSLLAKHKEQI